MWSKLSHSLDFGAHMHASYCLRPFFFILLLFFSLNVVLQKLFSCYFFFMNMYIERKKKVFFLGQNMLYKVRIIRNIFVKCKLRKRKKELSIFFNWNIYFREKGLTKMIGIIKILLFYHWSMNRVYQNFRIMKSFLIDANSTSWNKLVLLV